MPSKLNKYDGSGRLYGLDNPRPKSTWHYAVFGYRLHGLDGGRPVEKLLPYCDGRNYLKRHKRAAAKTLQRKCSTRGR